MRVPPAEARSAFAHDGGDEAAHACALHRSPLRSPDIAAESQRTRVCAACRRSQLSPHVAAETRRTRVCAARKRARGAALSARGGSDEAVTCVCRPHKRAALSTHGVGDEADTGVLPADAHSAPRTLLQRRGGHVCVPLAEARSALRIW